MSRTGWLLTTTAIATQPLTQVLIASPANGQSLVYDSANTRWINGSPTITGGTYQPSTTTLVLDGDFSTAGPYSITATTMTPATFTSFTPVAGRFYRLELLYFGSMATSTSTGNNISIQMIDAGGGATGYSGISSANGILTPATFPIDLFGGVANGTRYIIDGFSNRTGFAFANIGTLTSIGFRFKTNGTPTTNTLTTINGKIRLYYL